MSFGLFLLGAGLGLMAGNAKIRDQVFSVANDLAGKGIDMLKDMNAGDNNAPPSNP